eukprot:TRINITY_DN2339_c0_g1_i4.p1 TRINITY_DN2339_c0_g1~~TRINITY_DN2339_c0_g1_i4.p1  ORF type:complete len:427 (+),score=68.97 TRINITY_DN2339_c0_g1_i4:44-1282(+)
MTAAVLRVSGPALIATQSLQLKQHGRRTKVGFVGLQAPCPAAPPTCRFVSLVNIKHVCFVIKASSVETSVTSTIEEDSKLLKSREKLLEAVVGVSGRGRGVSSDLQKVISDSVEVLEANGGLPDPTEQPALEGRWQLMYTTRPGTASPIQRTFVGVDAFKVFQEIVLTGTDDPRVSNIVEFSESFGLLKVQAAASVGSGRRINFQFDRAAFELKFWPYRLPYPVPFRLLGDEAKGWLDTTYLSPSGDLRISRGNKGTTFILQKELTERQKLLKALKKLTDGEMKKVIEQFAASNPTEAPAKSPELEGRWRLVWSSQAADANRLQRWTAGLAANWQIIDGEAMRLENVVEFLPGLKLRAGADTTVTSDIRTDVNINTATLEVGSLKIPLPLKGKGYVEQMYAQPPFTLTLAFS